MRPVILTWRYHTIKHHGEAELSACFSRRVPSFNGRPGRFNLHNLDAYLSFERRNSRCAATPATRNLEAIPTPGHPSSSCVRGVALHFVDDFVLVP